MRQVREVLRLRTAGVGLNEIARRVGVAPSTVRLTLKRLASAGFSWPLPAEMTDSALEAALRCGRHQARPSPPRWAEIHRELNPQARHPDDAGGVRSGYNRFRRHAVPDGRRAERAKMPIASSSILHCEIDQDPRAEQTWPTMIA